MWIGKLQTDENFGWDAHPGDKPELHGLLRPLDSARTDLTDHSKFWECTVVGVLFMYCYIKLTQQWGNIGYNPSKKALT